MESAVDRAEVTQAAPVQGPAAAEPSVSAAAERPREYDDIPSVVRALLTGYDEA